MEKRSDTACNFRKTKRYVNKGVNILKKKMPESVRNYLSLNDFININLNTEETRYVQCLMKD